MNEINIFKEISIGGLDKELLLQRLVEAGIRFNDYAKILFDHPKFFPSHSVKKVKLVKVKPTDLGLKNPYSIEKLLQVASTFGLRPCPLYLAAFLRLEYLDQEEGPYCTIASALPESDENFPTGFYIRNFENSLWLRGYRAQGECDHPANNEFIFLK